MTPKGFQWGLGLGLVILLSGSDGWGEAQEPRGEAPKQGMVLGRWASGVKDFVATSYEAYDGDHQYSGRSFTAPISRVWATGAQGVLSEVFWPTVDRAQVVDSQFLITDQQGSFIEERRDMIHETKWIRPGVPLFLSISRDPQGRFEIERSIWTDPDSDVVLQSIKITRRVHGLNFYYLHNPSVGNSALEDSAELLQTRGLGFCAWQGQEAQALVFGIPLKEASVSFEGARDGFHDLKTDGRMDDHFAKAMDGNVSLMASLQIPPDPGSTEFVLALAFGRDCARAEQWGHSALENVEESRQKFIQQWEVYQSGLNDLSFVSGDSGKLYRASTALLKSVEDKTNAGAFVASASVPWGPHQQDQELSPSRGTGGYHLVWPRDLYQMATALMEAGDSASAVASLNFLKKIQFGPQDGAWTYGSRVMPRSGAFVQNCWVDGKPHWMGLQMDQTAYPILLLHRLWKQRIVSLKDYAEMMERAAQFIRLYGPWTGQERWEENFGVSPSTVASEISALWAAAEMTDSLGLSAQASGFRETASAWSTRPGDHLESWTFTTTGGLGHGRYYERLEGASSPDQRWDPNDEEFIQIQNGGEARREKDVLDGGFLELVRLGVRRALDPHVLDAIAVYDQVLSRKTASGVSYYRYNGDRYNYDEGSGRQTAGMLWPILTGERAHYALAQAIELGANSFERRSVVRPYVWAMEHFATPSLMIPEQVWDGGAFQGLPTGAATPLSWSHAEYVKLLASSMKGAVVDQIWKHSSQFKPSFQEPRVSSP